MPILLDEGSENDVRRLELATKKRTPIKNAQRYEQPPIILREAVNFFKTAHPVAELRSVTATYNCVGMVFGARRTWIDPDEIRLILRDDEFKPVDEPNVFSGDVILYKNPVGEYVHVGIIIKVESLSMNRYFKVLSKWGREGEYIHDVRDLPATMIEEYHSHEYWTDRKLI